MMIVIIIEIMIIVVIMIKIVMIITFIIIYSKGKGAESLNCRPNNLPYTKIRNY